ncbi:HNH endonuclease, partial [Clostridium estertheticum]
PDGQIVYIKNDPIKSGGGGKKVELNKQQKNYNKAVEESKNGNKGAGEAVVNRKGIEYPKIDVEGYGEVELPKGPYTPNNTKILRPNFTTKVKKGFKEWWIAQGRIWPEGEVNIHHIKPLSKGGDNSFENLVPLIQPEEHQPFTNWWRSYP